MTSSATLAGTELRQSLFPSLTGDLFILSRNMAILSFTSRDGIRRPTAFFTGERPCRKSEKNLILGLLAAFDLFPASKAFGVEARPICLQIRSYASCPASP